MLRGTASLQFLPIDLADSVFDIHKSRGVFKLAFESPAFLDSVPLRDDSETTSPFQGGRGSKRPKLFLRHPLGGPSGLSNSGYQASEPVPATLTSPTEDMQVPTQGESQWHNRQTSLKYREERRPRPSIVSVPSQLGSWDL